MYAVDFAMPVGTDVVAARDGVVFDVSSTNFKGGPDADQYADLANLVNEAALMAARVGMTRLLLGRWLFLSALGATQVLVMFLWAAIVFGYTTSPSNTLMRIWRIPSTARKASGRTTRRCSRPRSSRI